MSAVKPGVNPARKCTDKALDARQLTDRTAVDLRKCGGQARLDFAEPLPEQIGLAVRLFEDGRAVIVDTVLCRRAQQGVLRKIISRGSIFQDGHHVGKRHFPVAVHIAPGIEHVGKAAFQRQQRIQGGEMPVTVEVAAAASGRRSTL